MQIIYLKKVLHISVLMKYLFFSEPLYPEELR
jgi:hypothetical protein